jgi:hypothetical protein
MIRQRERNTEMLEMYLEGYTLQEVGQHYGISRERVRQIIVKRSSDRHYGARKRMLMNERVRKAYEAMQNGSTMEAEAEKLGLMPKSLYSRFLAQGMTLRPKSPLHGTVYRYQKGCRCDECKKGNRVYRLRFREMEPPEHGSYSSYSNYHCRCDACRAAASEYNRRVRGRRKERIA